MEYYIKINNQIVLTSEAYLNIANNNKFILIDNYILDLNTNEKLILNLDTVENYRKEHSLTKFTDEQIKIILHKRAIIKALNTSKRFNKLKLDFINNLKIT